jgi:chaperonin GroES
MKYIPRLDFVVVRKDAPKDMSKGGILLPQDARDDRAPAEVVAIGPGRMTEYGVMITVDGLEVGDRVLFNKFEALELNESDRLYLVRAGAIGCVINDK